MRTLQDTHAVPTSVRPLLLECKRLVQTLLPDAAVLLYGSRARGTGAAEFDYDVLVLADAQLPRAQEDRVRDAVYELELDRGVVISLLFYAKAQWNDPVHRVMPFHREVEREGILL